MRHLRCARRRFGPRRVLGGLARISSTLDAEGRIHQIGTFNALAFGRRDAGETCTVDEVANALRVPGFDALLSRDIRHEMWEKWVFIAAAASTTSFMRATVGDIVAAEAPDIRGRTAAGMRRDCRRERFLRLARHCQSMRVVRILTAPGSAIHGFDVAGYRAQGSRIEADHIVGDLLRRASKAPPAHRCLPPPTRIWQGDL